MWAYWSGPFAKRWNPPLIKWMEEEGMADDFLKGFDWDTFDHATATQETIDRMEEPTGKFFLTHTRAELSEGAVKHRTMLGPMSTVADVVKSVQLAAREYWVEVEHPELGTAITYPGIFAKASETPPRISRRAPLIGEHNEEVYEKELGIPMEKLLILKQARII